MSSDRPAIPAAIKQAVRQACGFGCVLCGAPVFHYDHIVDYSEVKEHAVDNLALLCPTHHQNKSSRRLPREIVAKARMSPFNRSRELTASDRWYFSGSQVRFLVGDNRFVFDFDGPAEWGNVRSAIRINGQDVLSMRLIDGELLLTAIFHDQVGRTILFVKDGEVVVSTRVFDYDIVGPKIVLKDRGGDILLELQKLDDGVHVARGLFRKGKTSLVITPEALTMLPMNIVIGGGTAIGGREAVVVDGPDFPEAANESFFG